ncbi:MAG: leucine--tRNA ligase [Candidatus Bathyarchaeota archaeon]|nr:leucine--tRNA ligase [Candidatus Termiticorpusculum sp.]
MSQTTKQIEEKWLAKWDAAHIFEADPNPVKQKIMVTFPFPYMNGPLHVGHAFSASRVDAYARFKRMQGYNVLWPWAWHWTGQPILGASQRIAKGDQTYTRVLREVDGVPQEELQKFVDPNYLAQYYTNEGKNAAKRIGFSVDWRREFTTVWPTFQKFIEWQYKNLKELGYVIRGTHPVVWCPKDQSPTGDHDRQSGEGITPEKYTLIKYKLDENTVLPAATFRPETIYGITNLWINPDATYVEAKVNDKENWIISQEAAEKLKDQEKTLTINRTLKGKELIGKTFENPLTRDKFPILPGWFVDTKTATGIVYSVPAHAPFDWLALKDLQQKPEIMHDFGIDPQIVLQIKPVSIIKVDGFGEHPAVEIVEQMGIKDQHDSKADQATKELYKKEFHSGKLKSNCGIYAGKSIREVKDQLVTDFTKLDIADIMYDLPEQVVCRCMTPCIVKILSDQWFLNYSNPAWKEKAKEVISQMKIYPETVRADFYAKIDWLKEWACARTTGFGTPVPWGQGWIIETLSDSTLYMAFYTINKHINQNNISPKALTPEVFDYIYHGKGDKTQITNATPGITVELLDAMRKEFLYWYPFDLRNSAKELVPNHLSFCIFHHAALFPPQHWPRGIGVNGMLMVEGQGMHKSKGNFITLKSAIDKYGADATRCGLMMGAEGMDDPDWRADNVNELKNKFEALTNFATNIVITPPQTASIEQIKNSALERWLQNKLQYRICEVTEALEELKTRTALQTALFEVWNDIRWYMQRKGNTTTAANAVALVDTVKIWIKLLTPFAPYMCEEIWSQTGETGFISTAEWPQFDEKKIDFEAEEQENLIIDILADTQNILKATKITPKQLVFYTAATWKWQIYLKILEKTKTGETRISDLMKEFSNTPELKPYLKDIAALVPKILKTATKLSTNRKTNMIKIQNINEQQIIQNALNFLKDKFDAEITVYSEDDKNRYDPKNRAPTAIPYQPAIYIQ